MKTALLRAHSNAQRLTLMPSEIRAGDWLRDLGRLRRVDTIAPVDTRVTAETTFVIRFEDEPCGNFGTLGVPASISVTIWREP